WRTPATGPFGTWLRPRQGRNLLPEDSRQPPARMKEEANASQNIRLDPLLGGRGANGGSARRSRPRLLVVQLLQRKGSRPARRPEDLLPAKGKRSAGRPADREVPEQVRRPAAGERGAGPGLCRPLHRGPPEGCR